MKILFVSPYLPKHTGGGEKYLFDCAKILLEEGHEVYMAISQKEALPSRYAQQIQTKYEEFLDYSLDGIRFIASPLFTSASWWRKLLFTASFDVIYYQTDGSLFFSLANKNILHIQVPLRLDKSSYLEKIKLANWQVKNTNSEFTKKYIERFWGSKIDFVHQPFVDAREFTGNGAKSVQKQPIILSVGRFFCQLHSKRQDILVQFFKDLVIANPQALKGWQLVLVGKKEDEQFAKSVAKLSKGLPIKILHDIDRKELIKLYQQASVYWHAAGFEIDETSEPEKVEHFGISTLEAMVAGAVPIVINKGGQKEILGRDISECLWDDEEDCLAKTLELIKNENKRKELAQKSRERSLLFSKEKFKNILLTMIEAKT